ncbi:C-4 methylsterol oxidase [Aureococcus anophagefferens]|nr:C-4 methylsterol oxidase [Aureococcus anophagefferens]
MLSRGWEVVRRRSCSTCAPRQTMSGKENFASPPAHGGAGRTPLQDAENITFRGSEVDLFSPSQDIFSPHITVRKRRRGRRAHQDAEAWASPVPADDDDDDEAPFVPPGLVVERDVAAEPQAAEPAPESAPVLSPCGDAGPEVVALADAEDGDPSAGYDPRSPAKPAPNLTCVSLRKVGRPAATTRPVSPEKLDFVAELVSPLLASPEAFRDGGSRRPSRRRRRRRTAGAARAAARRSLDALTTFADRTADALPLAEVEFRRATTRDRGVVHPNSSFRRLWDLAAMVAALVVVAGGAPAARARAPRVATLVDAGGSAFFLADVALNFRTGYVSKGTLVLRSGRIAARYASTWLAPDLVTALGHSALVRDGAAALYGAWRGRGERPRRRC